MKEKKLSGILNCADAVIEKIEQFAVDVKHLQSYNPLYKNINYGDIGMSKVPTPEYLK